MREYAYVYILANGFKKLYIGVTSNLQRRIVEHKQKQQPDSHTSRYGIDRLVYFERFTSIGAANQPREATQRMAAHPQARTHRRHKSGLARPKPGLGYLSQRYRHCDCSRR